MTEADIPHRPENERVDNVARALCHVIRPANKGQNSTSWRGALPQAKEFYRRLAQAALDAIDETSSR